MPFDFPVIICSSETGSPFFGQIFELLGDALVAAESSHVIKKTTRVLSESTRVTENTTRVISETTRVTKKSTRVLSENTRVVFLGLEPLGISYIYPFR